MAKPKICVTHHLECRLILGGYVNRSMDNTEALKTNFAVIIWHPIWQYGWAVSISDRIGLEWLKGPFESEHLKLSRHGSDPLQILHGLRSKKRRRVPRGAGLGWRRCHLDPFGSKDLGAAYFFFANRYSLAQVFFKKINVNSPWLTTRRICGEYAENDGRHSLHSLTGGPADMAHEICFEGWPKIFTADIHLEISSHQFRVILTENFQSLMSAFTSSWISPTRCPVWPGRKFRK